MEFGSHRHMSNSDAKYFRTGLPSCGMSDQLTIMIEKTLRQVQTLDVKVRSGITSIVSPQTLRDEERCLQPLATVRQVKDALLRISPVRLQLRPAFGQCLLHACQATGQLRSLLLAGSQCVLGPLSRLSLLNPLVMQLDLLRHCVFEQTTLRCRRSFSNFLWTTISLPFSSACATFFDAGFATLPDKTFQSRKREGCEVVIFIAH